MCHATSMAMTMTLTMIREYSRARHSGCLLTVEHEEAAWYQGWDDFGVDEAG